MNEQTLVDLFNKIRSADPAARQAAWQTLGKLDAAVGSLCDAMGSADKPIAKAAKYLLEAVVHRAARPEAATEALSVTKELVKVANSRQSVAVRGYAVHLTGFTAGHDAIYWIAPLLTPPDVQDEARMALERIPGSAATNALKNAMKTATPAFRAALAQSLANRNAGK